jgi:TolB protein
MGEDHMRHIGRTALLVAALTVALVGLPASSANAANPGTPGAVVFVSGGNIFRAASPGAPAVQATTTGSYAWPKLSPVYGNEVAYLYKSNLYLGGFDVSGHIYTIQQLTTGGHTGPPSWSPDGQQIAYIQKLDYQVLYIAHLGSSASAVARPGLTVRSTTSRRVGPAVVQPAVIGSWSTLSTSLGVAWSPNGEGIAFPGGDCLGIVDACLSVVDLATNVERVVAAWGGGGNVDSGYATDPAWTADSAHLMWNQQVWPGDSDTIGPIQIWQTGPYGGARVQIGHDGDSQPAPSPAADGSLLVTATHNGAQWVTKIASGGARTYLYKGYEEDWGVATP